MSAPSPSAHAGAGGHNQIHQVVSEPLKKIVGEGRNYKYVQNCHELHLGGESIQVLQDFDKFENLEVLFLNDNNLVTIVGLEKNFRLRRLYLMVRQHRHPTHTKICTHISRFGRHRS